MTTNILNARISEETDAQARAAVKAFRAMQPTLSSYARVLTGKKNVRVDMAAQDNGSTDGTRIFFRPPIELGDPTPHVRSKCDKRDEYGFALCKACRIRESVMTTIYHEIAHICFDSFQTTTDRDKRRAIAFAVKEAKGKYADLIRARIDNAPSMATNSFMGLATLINEYLPFLLNCLEDARVNAKLFEARSGLRRSFELDSREVFENGFENRDPDGQIRTKMWSEAPLNSQVMIGCFCKASGYEYHGWFHPDIEAVLDDEQLTGLISTTTSQKDAAGVFQLSFHVLQRLRELGYLGTPQDPDPEPEEGDTDASEDQTPDQDSDSGEQSDSSGDGSQSDSPEDESPSGEHEGSDDSGREGAPPGPEDSAGDSSLSEDDGDDSTDRTSEATEGDVDEGADSTPPSDSDDLAGDDVSQDGDSSESSEELGDHDSEGTDAGDSSSSSDEGERDDSSGEDSGGQSEWSDDSTESDVSDLADGSNSGGSPSDMGEHGSEDDDNSDSDVGDEKGNEVDDEADSTGDGRADRPVDRAVHGDSDDGEASDDSPEHDAGHGDEPESGDGEADLSGSEGDAGSGPSDERGPDNAGLSREDESAGEELDDEPIDTGADDGYGGTRLLDEPNPTPPRPEMGTPDDVDPVLKKFGDHDEKPKSAAASEAEDAMDRAIIQGIYFTTPSVNVYGVNEYEYGEGEAWKHSLFGRRVGTTADVVVPEQVLQPAVIHTRRAFTDNQIGGIQANRKSGRINRRVLGRRAWNDDPRLFAKKTQPGTRDYEVIIGVDVSYSTVGVNLALEKRAVMAQAELLDRVGIPFSIYAHSGAYDYDSRALTVEVFKVKKPGEPWNDKTKRHLSELAAVSANLDGHAMEYLRKRADESRATDKIILYYSDGKMPQENHDEELEILTSEIALCRRKGYHLLGVGIRTDSPARHGLDTVQVDTDEDLVKVVKHLGKRLKD